MGHADQQVAEKLLDLFRIMAQALQVRIHRSRPGLVQAAADAAHQRALLVVPEVVPGLAAQDGADAPQVAGDLLADALPVAPLPLPQTREVLHQPGGHLRHRQHVIDGAGEDGAARHAVEARRGGGLDQGQAAVLLDRLEAQGAVGAGAGEDDAHGLVLLVLGQRAEEAVDGRAPAADRPRRLRKVQHAVVDGQRAVRRHDVDVVGVDHRLLLDHPHRHRRQRGEELGDERLVAGREVLNEDEGEAGVGRHVAEQLPDGVQAAGGGADRHHRAGVGIRARGRARLHRRADLLPSLRILQVRHSLPLQPGYSMRAVIRTTQGIQEACQSWDRRIGGEVPGAGEGIRTPKPEGGGF